MIFESNREVVTLVYHTVENKEDRQKQPDGTWKGTGVRVNWQNYIFVDSFSNELRFSVKGDNVYEKFIGKKCIIQIEVKKFGSQWSVRLVGVLPESK